jgi:hypothetical protein
MSKKSGKKTSLFFWRIFLEVSVFTGLTVGGPGVCPGRAGGCEG